MIQNTPAPSPKSYFLQLAEYGSKLLDRLPIEREPQPLEYALGQLAPVLEQKRDAELVELRQLTRPEIDQSGDAELGVGLNSIGMLADRFTILIIKEWCLRNKGSQNPEKARELFEKQTLDIIEALANARPGNSSMNSKITHIKGDAVAAKWEEAFYGLLTTNLVLWESQEILYIRDIQELPAEELRSYIKWFSYGNMRRNEYIQLCEEFYWQS
jgi:hypothetical protein